MPSETMTSPLLQATGIELSYRDRKVLDHISLTLRPGQIMTIIGPNGTGKSSLIRVLLGLLTPQAGRIERRPGLRIGYMPQKLQLDRRMPLTVRGFLQLAKGADFNAIDHWLQRLSIQSLAEQSVHSLSGGEWQRVLLARALLRNPELLVLDEPVQGVDVQGQAELYALIPELRDELGCAVLMISHDLHLVMSATDEVLCLNGHICCSGHPDSVTADPAYLQLFGKDQQPVFAPYVHHHDHDHSCCDHTDTAAGAHKHD
ncbi:MAG: zinc ABC transporter ATP-binding protein ZnuC [Oceanospirillaceae bacterium]|nr:zinc ABC transporter ATP-binding protein ZnuC [Oceanospirillaceae bacterium]